MTIETASRKLVGRLRAQPTKRAGSLITTVFGDAIAPRGGTVWLGSLIRVMRVFGINERLVRTSVFRLVRDGWLQSRLIGRRSYYSLTDEGRERFEQATHRIYGEPAAGWDGRWCLVLLGGLESDMKDSIRREFGWLGFGALSANLLAHPAPDMTDLDVTLRRLNVIDEIVVMEGQTIRNDAAMRRLAGASWNLDDIDRRYARFVDMFRPLYTALRKDARISPETAFTVRTLLIQEYRKVLLRDPQLPLELLPAGWHGIPAYQLCRNLYRAVHVQADTYLSAAMETADGPLPPPAAGFNDRFGGLDAAPMTT